LKYYIENNRVPLVDVIISSLNKTSASFLLTTEGKNLLLDKIMRELNDYLERVGPRGKIVDGYVTSILGATDQK
jgi:flagellar basal body-associated protein FliL